MMSEQKAAALAFIEKCDSHRIQLCRENENLRQALVVANETIRKLTQKEGLNGRATTAIR